MEKKKTKTDKINTISTKKNDNWREFNKGDIVHYHKEDFDGVVDRNAIVIEKYVDHLLLQSGDVKIWIDDNSTEKLELVVDIRK